MSKVSRTTLEKRQIQSIVGGGALPFGGSYSAVPTATNQPMAAATAAVGGCGCEAFAPVASAADIAFSDGSFPSFIQTACLVTYRDSVAAEIAAVAATKRVTIASEAALNGKGDPLGSRGSGDEELGSPSPGYKGGSYGDSGSIPPTATRLSYSESRSPSRRETTFPLNLLALRASSQPVFAPDDAYDIEVDTYDAEGESSGAKESSGEADASGRIALTNTAPNDLVTEVWTAESDGSISVRNATNGRHCKGQPRIPPFGKLSQALVNGGGNCFVNALIHVRGYVFAGYVDGMLRGFDVVTKQLCFEKRKHAGSITAMAQWKENIIFTASDDFRIMMWRVGEERTPDANLKAKRARPSNFSGSAAATAVFEPELPSFLHQLPGHGCRVHALHVEGDYLYSGGDEGLIKCWDIRTRMEVVTAGGAAGMGRGGVWPILAHPNGGVRDITCCQSVLITAGKGGVCLFDMATSELMKRFGEYADVNRVLVDPTSLVLWICCSSTGTVTLIDLYTFRDIGVIADFSAATIKGIHTVVTSPATRVFLGEKGKGLSVAYLEGGATGMLKSYTPVNAATEAKCKTLDVLRDEIYGNEANLASYRELLWSVRDTDQYHKHKASLILNKGAQFQQRKLFLERCILFVIRSRHINRQMVIASALGKGCEQRLRFTALLKWYLFRRSARDARFKEFVTNSLTAEHERQVIGRQLQNVMIYMSHAQRMHNRSLIAPMLELYQIRRTFINIFLKWRQWVFLKKERDRQVQMVGYLHNRSHKQTQLRSFRKLHGNITAGHLKAMYIIACTNLERNNKAVLLRRYVQEWIAFRLQKRRTLQNMAMSKLVSNYYEVPLRRRYYDILWSHAMRSIKAKAEARRAADDARSAQIEVALKEEAAARGEGGDSPSASNELQAAEIEALDAEIAKLEKELAEAQRVNDGVKGNIADMSFRETALLLACGVASDAVASEKAVPKRRAAAGEAPPAVGAFEGITTPAAAATAAHHDHKDSAHANNKGHRHPTAALGASYHSAHSGAGLKAKAKAKPHDGDGGSMHSFRAFADAENDVDESEYPPAAPSSAHAPPAHAPSAPVGVVNLMGLPPSYSLDAGGASLLMQCANIMRMIKSSGFNLKVARADIVRRSKKSGGEASTPPSVPTTPRGGALLGGRRASTPRGASTVKSFATAAEGFSAAVEAFYDAIAPYTSEASDAFHIDDAWAVDEGKMAKISAVKRLIGPAHDLVVAWDYVSQRLSPAATLSSLASATSADASFLSRVQLPADVDCDIPHLDAVVNNSDVITGLFGKYLSVGSALGSFSQTTTAAAANGGSRGVSPTPAARRTSPSPSRNPSPSVSVGRPRTTTKPSAAYGGAPPMQGRSTTPARTSGYLASHQTATAAKAKAPVGGVGAKRSTASPGAGAAPNAAPLSSTTAKSGIPKPPSRLTTAGTATSTATARKVPSSAALTANAAASSPSPAAAKEGPTKKTVVSSGYGARPSGTRSPATATTSASRRSVTPTSSSAPLTNKRTVAGQATTTTTAAPAGTTTTSTKTATARRYGTPTLGAASRSK